jgi:uncharacterized protein (DUF486 family)
MFRDTRQPDRLSARVAAGQHRITREIVTLAVFAIFAVSVPGEPVGRRYPGAFACMAGATAFMFVGLS